MDGKQKNTWNKDTSSDSEYYALRKQGYSHDEAVSIITGGDA
jgi:hypothetical protein